MYALLKLRRVSRKAQGSSLPIVGGNALRSPARRLERPTGPNPTPPLRTSKCAIATFSASGEAQTPRRKEVGTQEPEIPTIATLERAI